jgi:hypothetical protein
MDSSHDEPDGSVNQTDMKTAATMQQFAEAFIEGATAEGEVFGWESTEASRLDDFCDAFVASQPPAEYRRSMIMAMGAYLGELLVRHGNGRWIFDPVQNAAAVELPNGLRGYPHNKVAKRLDQGPEHNLFLFYWHGLTKDVPPGTNITIRSNPTEPTDTEPSAGP